eukprot:GFKZ01011396.1.p1 GENE.GFKZ01011396.1~~GFKZ01011396.1.p1  ORF type:complete len:494 (+),score=75.88 GFKZ01011396.1:32-1513(+)
MAFALSKATLLCPSRFLPRPCSLPRRPPVVKKIPPIMSNTKTALDRASFKEEWTLFALKVPSKLCQGTRKALNNHILSMPRLRSVLHAQEPDTPKKDAPPRMLLLLKYFAENVQSNHRHPPRGNAQENMIGCGTKEMAQLLRKVEMGCKVQEPVKRFVTEIQPNDVVRKKINVAYEHWSLDEVLRSVIPEGVTVPTSFETVGHLVHLNLRDEQAEWKNVIGQAFLDKLAPRIRTVVNKLASTGGPYRTFKMEVLAGEEQLVTKVKENGCVFELDFGRVYWNSRLEREHGRIVRSLKKGDVLADAFCGVGPFAIPAMKAGKCGKVYANDLNPASVEYLRRNAKLNRVEGENFVTSCGCARSFLKKVISEEGVAVTKVVMNFPSGAPEFLNAFRGLYVGRESLPMPTVHCYCFVKGIEEMGSARERIRNVLFGGNYTNMQMEDILPDVAIDVRDVRDVAPRKRQICVTFQLPADIAFHNREDSLLQPTKKQKMSC